MKRLTGNIAVIKTAFAAFVLAALVCAVIALVVTASSAYGTAASATPVENTTAVSGHRFFRNGCFRGNGYRNGGQY